jgi:transcription initiation factor TFIID subunit 2
MSSKQNKKSSQWTSGSNRNFKLLHQSLTISEINFKKQTIIGSTELTVLPLTNTGKLWRLPLNCKQCRILRVTVNGSHKANNSYVDPTLSICPPETKKRNLEYYDTCHYDAIQSCDSDCSSSAGELIIKIPKAAYDSFGAFGENCFTAEIPFSVVVQSYSHTLLQ